MENLLEIKGLTIKINDREQGDFYALSDFSINIGKGQALGIVGESGSGKSVTALAIMGLSSKDSLVEKGEILYKGRNLLKISPKEISAIRGDEISMIFQDPMSSLNPLIKAGKQVEESIKLHSAQSPSQIKSQALKAMEYAGLKDIDSVYDSYPHELSGGMRQRVMIASAIACRPELIIADEPTTALDSTTQKQILELFIKMKNEEQMSLMFISHDLGVIGRICDYVAVIYRGFLLEFGKCQDVIKNPAHPYTSALIKCIPSPDKKGKPLFSIKGNSYINKGEESCPFAGRCDFAIPECFARLPEIIEENGRKVRCLRHGEIL